MFVSLDRSVTTGTSVTPVADVAGEVAASSLGVGWPTCSPSHARRCIAPSSVQSGVTPREDQAELLARAGEMPR
jgi:hypothetical protein